MSTVPQVPAPDKSLDTLCEELYGTSTTAAVRQEWEHAVRGVAAKATAVLPAASAERIGKAVQMVLSYRVELLPDGKARVESQCDAGRVYHLANGTCTCPDFQRAPAQWCKHRISRALHIRAMRVIRQTTEDMEHAQCHVPSVETPAVDIPATPPFPEAPASANCHIMLAGRQVQVTLRDTDEGRLLVRLAAVLAQYPVEQAAATPAEGWCALHQVQMRRNTKDDRSWYSHTREDGSWCKGK